MERKKIVVYFNLHKTIDTTVIFLSCETILVQKCPYLHCLKNNYKSYTRVQKEWMFLTRKETSCVHY